MAWCEQNGYKTFSQVIKQFFEPRVAEYIFRELQHSAEWVVQSIDEESMLANLAAKAGKVTGQDFLSVKRMELLVQYVYSCHLIFRSFVLTFLILPVNQKGNPKELLQDRPHHCGQGRHFIKGRVRCRFSRGSMGMLKSSLHGICHSNSGNVCSLARRVGGSKPLCSLRCLQPPPNHRVGIHLFRFQIAYLGFKRAQVQEGRRLSPSHFRSFFFIFAHHSLIIIHFSSETKSF